MSFTRETIPDFLTWLLSIVELIIVFSIALFTGYLAFCFLFETSGELRITRLMQTVNQNWKAAIVLLIPLIYRPLRTFLEDLQEAGPFKRKTLTPSDKQEETNPVSPMVKS